ncbi:MAG: glycosyltransferase family 39 protein [Candidatus Levyibacteriota bacterium]
MNKFTKYLGLFIVLAIFYFVLRLYHLTNLPIFTDESIYIRWAQIGLGDPMYRFLSLTDGKQPLFIWIMYPFLKIFHDPLVGGRMVSVFTGFFTMLGLGLVSFTLFKKRSWALFTMALYIAYPFAQVMDRMALYDSMVAMFFIWSVYASLMLIKSMRLTDAYNLGFILGAENLTKLPVFFSILLLPITLILFDFRQKHWRRELLKWFGFTALSVVISQVMYFVVKLSPLPNVTNEKNNTFYYPISEWIHHPFQFFIGNFQGMTASLLGYLTIPYILLVLVALFYLKKNFKEKVMLLIYFLLPYIGFALIGKEIFARYVFFMSLPLILLAGWGLGYLIDLIIKYWHIKAQMRFVTAGFIAIIFLLYPLYVCLSFAANPIAAPIPQSDKTQYVTAWTSGWGLKDAVTYLQNQAQSGPIYVATEGTFGLYPQGIELYLSKNPNVSIKGYYWEITKDFPKDLVEKAKTMPTYFIFYQPCPGGFCDRPGDAPAGWPVRVVQTYTHPNTQTRVVIYQVEEGTLNENIK